MLFFSKVIGLGLWSPSSCFLVELSKESGNGGWPIVANYKAKQREGGQLCVMYHSCEWLVEYYIIAISIRLLQDASFNSVCPLSFPLTPSLISFYPGGGIK